MLLKKKKNLLKIRRDDKKTQKNIGDENKELSNNSSISKNSSKIEQSRLSKKRKFNSYAEDLEKPENDEHILKKIRQGDKSIFLINKDVKSEIKSEDSNKNKSPLKDTVVRFRNRKF